MNSFEVGQSFETKYNCILFEVQYDVEVSSDIPIHYESVKTIR
jgi:hypothetical protein